MPQIQIRHGKVKFTKKKERKEKKERFALLSKVCHEKGSFALVTHEEEILQHWLNK